MPIFREGHAEFLYDFDVCICMHGNNSFAYYTTQAIMKVSGRVVERWLRSAVQDMYLNNRTRVICPCRRCKGRVWLDPYDDGRVKAHLLMTGFMDGYTRWIIEDDDDEDADGAANDDTGQDEEMTDNGGGEGAGL